MALNDAIEQGLIGAGDLAVMIGSGVGYNLAGVVLRLTDRLAQQTLRSRPPDRILRRA